MSNETPLQASPVRATGPGDDEVERHSAGKESMTGLSVLYGREATKERDWDEIPDREKTSRLREVYWARRVERKSERKPFKMEFSWRPDRGEIGRGRYDPGDGFIYLVNMLPEVEDRFEWLEVTEVFTTVPAAQIESAMRAWNGIPEKDPVDFDEFRKSVVRGRPSSVEQRKAADQVIAQIERKLAKRTYDELLEKYGYGTLVVGMPLWFAVLPDDPFRAENAVDDFMTRTALGLEEVKQRVLRRRDCPFGKVIVVWDTTPQAWREWRKARSAEYEDSANASLGNPLDMALLEWLTDGLEKAIAKTAIPESETPPMSMHLDIRTRKEAVGRGPYPRSVQAFSEISGEEDRKSIGFGAILKLRVSLMLWKPLCFVRIHGVDGLERWIARKLSVSHTWRVRVARRRARRFYRESIRTDRTASGPRNR